MRNGFNPRKFVVSTLILLFLVGGIRAEVSAPVGVEETRKDFLHVIDRPRVDLAAEQQTRESKDGFIQEHFTYATEAGQRIPGILIVKEQPAADAGRRPAIILLHGTGGNKDGLAGLMRRFADKGFVAVAIDGRFHGERGKQADYNVAIAQAFEKGGTHPLYYDTVWDVMRLVDYLQTRPEIDAKRIGLMGFSKGGIETWLTAAADPRIAAAVPTISVQSFAWGLEHDGWKARVGTVRKAFDAAAKSDGVEQPDAAFARKFYDRVIPGIHDRFDGPIMLTLIAPRPLLVIGGDKDPLNPIPGLELCEASAKAAYAKAGASEKFAVIVEPNTGHGVTPPATSAAIEWFCKYLSDEGKILKR